MIRTWSNGPKSTTHTPTSTSTKPTMWFTLMDSCKTNRWKTKKLIKIAISAMARRCAAESPPALWPIRLAGTWCDGVCVSNRFLQCGIRNCRMTVRAWKNVTYVVGRHICIYIPASSICCVHVCRRAYTCMLYMCLCARMGTCKPASCTCCTQAHTFVHIRAWVCTHVWAHAHLQAVIYVLKHIHTYMHTHVCVCMHI